jgi:hypothetical protein
VLLRLVALPDDLDDEDLLAMLAAGVLQFIVVDEWRGRLWAPVLPALRLREDLLLRDDVLTGWAVRKGSPLLAAELEHCFREFLKEQGVVEWRLAAYQKGARPADARPQPWATGAALPAEARDVWRAARPARSATDALQAGSDIASAGIEPAAVIAALLA